MCEISVSGLYCWSCEFNFWLGLCCVIISGKLFTPSLLHVAKQCNLVRIIKATGCRLTFGSRPFRKIWLKQGLVSHDLGCVFVGIDGWFVIDILSFWWMFYFCSDLVVTISAVDYLERLVSEVTRLCVENPTYLCVNYLTVCWCMFAACRRNTAVCIQVGQHTADWQHS